MTDLNYRVKLTLFTHDGRVGTQWLSENEASDAPMAWDREGDGHTINALFELYVAGEPVQSFAIGSDDWFDLEDEGEVHMVAYWVNRGCDLKRAVEASVQGMDPNGFSIQSEQAIDDLNAKIQELQSRLDSLAIYRVYVLAPLRFRERKHTMRIYRVGASSPDEAYQKVRALLDESSKEHASDVGLVITNVQRFSDVGSAILEGSFTKSKEDAAVMKEWKP